MTTKIASAPRTAFSQKLLDAMQDGRKVTGVPVNKLPAAARADVKSTSSDYGISTSKFQYGKSTFYVVEKSADDAFDIYDFFSKSGKSAGTQEVDM
jgi:hypothetical protein